MMEASNDRRHRFPIKNNKRRLSVYLHASYRCRCSAAAGSRTLTGGRWRSPPWSRASPGSARRTSWCRCCASRLQSWGTQPFLWTSQHHSHSRKSTWRIIMLGGDPEIRFSHACRPVFWFMFEDGGLRSPGDAEAGLEAVEAVTLGEVRVSHFNVRTLSGGQQVAWPTSEFMRSE